MIHEVYEQWLTYATKDPDLHRELLEIAGDEAAINDRFYRSLSFGTAGLRGEIGAGTNRMNIYTVGKASQGLADYVNSVGGGSIAIAYDSRIKSDVFAKEAACIFAANGLTVHLYAELMPTPMLSFAVRHLGCQAGIVITASHNPAAYNGYKAYGPDGCQLSPEASRYVLSMMDQTDPFIGVHSMDYDTALAEGRIRLIGSDVINAYLDAVQACSVAGGADLSGLKVIYTPLHGTGNKPVRAILDRIGIKDVTVVKEQEFPDGHFPTAPYPNPEIRQPFEPALALAARLHPDLLLATDPDCDRVGIAVPHKGDYRLMTGNEVGALLLQYVLLRRQQTGTMPVNPVAVKTIVTSDVCEKIAASFDCRLINVLTGFKFIGEQIGLLEARGEESRFVFGFEESYGYLGGSYVRDKDAVIASMLICEMVAYYKQQHLSLVDVLERLYERYGYYYCAQKSFSFKGECGMKAMADLLAQLRRDPPATYCGMTVTGVDDYLAGTATDTATGNVSRLALPSSDVLAFRLETGSKVVVRPSGTEPKVKFYLFATAPTADDCQKKLDEMVAGCAALAGVNE